MLPLWDRVGLRVIVKGHSTFPNFIHINSSITDNSFSIITLSGSIWPIDTTLSGATTLRQSGLGNDGKKGVLRISQNSSITGASNTGHTLLLGGHTSLQRCSRCILQAQPTGLDGLVSYIRTLVGERLYPSAEMQSVYSTALAGWKRWFTVITRTLVGERLYPSAVMQSVYSTAVVNSPSKYFGLILNIREG